ncbi:Beta-secretase 2 [Entophlyctis sp. JEL0112]|nr:Beta-secretase 2 [Entophlyctis sp. JEL0112]
MSGGPLIDGCFDVNITVSGIVFKVHVDTGSSDLVVPGPTLNAYTGPTFNSSNAVLLSTSGVVTATFSDGSSYSGAVYNATVSIAADATVAAPVVVMQSQSTSPAVVTDGSASQGVLGLAYDALAAVPAAGDGAARTVMSALVAAHAIAADVVAFRACPATATDDSVMDWGGADPALTCSSTTNSSSGTVQVWLAVVNRSYYAVDVTRIGVGAAHVLVQPPLPASWQQPTGADLSIVDSCTTVTLLPRAVFSALVQVLETDVPIDAWGGLATSDFDNFFSNGYAFANLAIDYTRLPYINFSITAADVTSTVDVQIPPEYYIQLDTDGYAYFTFNPHDNNGVVFGATFFDIFFVVLDRSNARIGLGPGCDCGSKIASNIRMPIVSVRQTTTNATTTPSKSPTGIFAASSNAPSTPILATSSSAAALVVTSFRIFLALILLESFLCAT